MKRKYHKIDKQGRVNERRLREFLVREGQGSRRRPGLVRIPKGSRATENAEAVQDLLKRLVFHGVDPKRRRRFVIDGPPGRAPVRRIAAWPPAIWSTILTPGVRSRTRRVCPWRPGMAARWSAAASLEVEKSFRKIYGLPGFVGFESNPRRIAARHSAGGGVQ